MPETENYLAQGIWHHNSTKTTSGMCRIWTTIADLDTGEIRPEWRGARILIAAPVFKQVKRGPIVKFDEVFDDTGLVLRKINGNSPRRDLDGDVEVHFFNVGPTGEGAEAWRGAEYAIFYPDEVAQMPEKTFNLGNATLRQKRRDGTPYEYQTIMTTTPLGQNWLWRRLLNPDTRAEYKSEQGPMYPDDKLFIIESSTQESIDAGILEPDYIANMGYIPGTLKYQEEVEGKVVATAGMVFEQGWNLISEVNPLPKHFTAVYGGIDYGTVDPTVIILAGIDERGAVWIFKEYYQARAKFHEYADLMGDWQQEFTVRQWSADSDLLVRMMRGAGLRCRSPYKAKDAAGVAVNYVNQLISRGMFNIDPHCYGLIAEMRAYRHKSMFDGDEVTFLQKVEPNQSDHAIDAMRYAVLPLSAAAAAQSYGKEVGFSIG